MSRRELTEKANEDYLAAALEWLRLRLRRLGGPERAAVLLPGEVAEPAPAPEAAPRRRFFRRQVTSSQPEHSAATTHLLPPAPDEPAVTDQQLQEAEDALRRAEASDPPPQLILLASRFGLSQFERDVLLLCVAMELDTRVAGLCARAQGDAQKPYPTFGLALALFDDPSWEALAAGGLLRFWQLVLVRQPDGQPLITSAISADERIVEFVKGHNVLYERLSPFFVPLEVGGSHPELPQSQRDLVEGILNAFVLQPGSQPPLIHLLGADARGKQFIALHAAAALGLQLFRLPAELLPTSAAEIETLARLLHRESLLLPIAVYLDAHEQDQQARAEGSAPQPWLRFVSRLSMAAFLDTRDVVTGLGRAVVPFDVTKPTQAEQRAAWAEALDPAAGDNPERLSAQFNLNLPGIAQIARQVLGAGEPAELTREQLRERLWDACLMHTRPRLEHLAQRLEPKATWEDLVLPPAEKGLLMQVAGRVRQRAKVYEEWGFGRKMNRGLGISALFAGDSGTGKTMSAEVLANDLRLDLYRIDLSAVVSKYIGETEKNLGRVFDAAEEGAAILFFDEADALFGKRSEVKDAHDRYANIEINYLLMRMEAFRGLAILATNMKSALDTAFMRRLSVIVDFPYPNASERKAIWQRVFPRETDTRGLDFDRLAQLSVPGGAIHNIALSAAFIAAQEGSPVTMPLLLQAAEQEFRKLGRTAKKADFRWNEAPAEEVA